MARRAAERLEALNAKVFEAELRGAWQRERGPAKREEIQPKVWRWNEMAPLLFEAGDLVAIDDVMKMRTLHMVNSSQTVPLGASRTFAAMLQHVNSGEVTESHRHTATSIYFMIQGNGLYTTAEGEQQFMEPGDLLTQPSWTWHGSTNTGTEAAVWFTAMDTSLMQFLDVWFAEKFPDGRSQPISQPDGYHMKRLGALRPPPAHSASTPYPLKYPWRKTIAALEELAKAGETDPHDGVILDYVYPGSGGPTTATLHCRMQLLGPAEETRSHRHTCNTVYFVVRGSGATRVGKNKTEGITLQWNERDCFNVPTWYWHCFKNQSSREPAILFSVSDRPLFQALRLYREEG